jgi:hypothetical protein
MIFVKFLVVSTYGRVLLIELGHCDGVKRCEVESTMGIPDTPMTHNTETLFVNQIY